MDPTGDRILGGLAVVAAASIWATLGLFAKILYAQGVSFEALVAVRASVGWVAVMIFVLATGKAKSLRSRLSNYFGPDWSMPERTRQMGAVADAAARRGDCVPRFNGDAGCHCQRFSAFAAVC